MFPVMGSITLFSLYLVFRFLNKEYVNYVLTAYFCILGVGSLMSSSMAVLRKITGKPLVGEYKLNIFKATKEITSFHFGYLDVGILLLSCVFSAVYAVTKHWILTDIYGEAFAISAIQLLKLDSFTTGTHLYIKY